MTILFGLIIILLLLILVINFLEPLAVKNNDLIDIVEAKLPQTQCGKCGFLDCRLYARALVDNQAEPDLCLPGGQDTARELSWVLGKNINYTHINKDKVNEDKETQIAVIDENNCIGCVKCAVACPVDAIVGAAKQMHSIITPYCTGCELCVAPCPVDCIYMTAVK